LCLLTATRLAAEFEIPVSVPRVAHNPSVSTHAGPSSLPASSLCRLPGRCWFSLIGSCSVADSHASSPRKSSDGWRYIAVGAPHGARCVYEEEDNKKVTARPGAKFMHYGMAIEVIHTSKGKTSIAAAILTCSLSCFLSPFS